MAGLADRDDFRMRGGVVRGRYAICAFSDNALAFHDDGGERTAARGAHVFKG